MLHITAAVVVFAFARIKELGRQDPLVANDAPKAIPAGSHSTHIVKEGETLSKIAFAYGVGIPDLIAANKLKNQDDIRTGQQLYIPEAKTAAKAPLATESRTPASTTSKAAPSSTQKVLATVSAKKPVKSYVVRKGDTAVKIARENACSYDDLVKLNNIKDPKKIQPGQVLKLPPKDGQRDTTITVIDRVAPRPGENE